MGRLRPGAVLESPGVLAAEAAGRLAHVAQEGLGEGLPDPEPTGPGRLRVHVRATGGDPSAAIYEVRCYER